MFLLLRGDTSARAVESMSHEELLVVRAGRDHSITVECAPSKASPSEPRSSLFGNDG